MNKLNDLDSSSVVPTITLVPTLNPRLGTRLHRSRRGFGSGKSRLSLNIDANCSGISTTSHSTPVSTSSTCTSKIVPWWELEYQCPPPGHLGAHVVPVSIDVPGTTKNVDPTKKLALKKCSLTSVETCFDEKKESFQSGVVIYETPERGRRDLHRKLLARRDSTPCLLIDNSPSQKRKMRSQDVIECEAALFSKELKRFHEFSQEITPSTFVQPLSQINIKK